MIVELMRLLAQVDRLIATGGDLADEATGSGVSVEAWQGMAAMTRADVDAMHIALEEWEARIARLDPAPIPVTVQIAADTKHYEVGPILDAVYRAVARAQRLK